MPLFYFVASNYPLAWAVTNQTLSDKTLYTDAIVVFVLLLQRSRAVKLRRFSACRPGYVVAGEREMSGRVYAVRFSRCIALSIYDVFVVFFDCLLYLHSVCVIVSGNKTTPLL